MSSPHPFQASSPFPPNSPHRRKSRFTYKHLAQLALYSTTCPLRVIAHVDLDAFYAQCEMVRLGVASDQPLAVQQWQGLIAINYPARKFGINRHATITDAKKACPNLICQHVATWREGDEKWAYHEEAAKNIATHKVSLDPYRLESRWILACIKATLPSNLQKVEKASVDEVFVDLSAQIHSILLQRYPELAGPAPYDDPTEKLPLPPTTVLDWKADALVDLDNKETEEDDPDWDDIAMLIGSEVVRDVRAEIFKQLKYTCSGGIAHNKMLSKLGSGHKKPNQQTVIRNRAVQQFLSEFKFTKIRGMGGKLGEEVVSGFNTDTIKELLPVPVEQLKLKLGDDTGTWVYNIVRGVESSEVSSRTQIKSMLSAKSFRPSINTPEQATRWLRIFVADIYSRLVEEGVIENKRRPKTMNLHHRQGGQTRSKQAPISQGKKIDETMLFDLARSLLGQIILEGRVWPCANLSLSIGGFEDGVCGNMGIGAFLIKGDEAKALANTSREASPAVTGSANLTQRPGAELGRLDKRRRLDPGISRFFTKTESTEEHDDDFGAVDTIENDMAAESPTEDAMPATRAESIEAGRLHQTKISEYICGRCNADLESSEALQNHKDWHFAKDLQDGDRVQKSPAVKPASTATQKKTLQGAGKKKIHGGVKSEKGQSKLSFG